MQVDNIFVFIRQVAVVFRRDNISVFIRQVAPVPAYDRLTLKAMSESRVTYVGYLCANFSLPRPLCYRLRPDVSDRQTSDRRRQMRIIA